jgi:ArsR family transcriptional regulator
MNLEPGELFSALSHPLRLRALMLLQAEQELCVCELTHVLGASQPMVSRHLAQLRAAGLVDDRRRGLWIYYRIHPQLPDWARDVLSATAAGTGADTPFADDRLALTDMPNRPGASCCA